MLPYINTDTLRLLFPLLKETRTVTHIHTSQPSPLSALVPAINPALTIHTLPSLILHFHSRRSPAPPPSRKWIEPGRPTLWTQEKRVEALSILCQFSCHQQFYKYFGLNMWKDLNSDTSMALEWKSGKQTVWTYECLSTHHKSWHFSSPSDDPLITVETGWKDPSKRHIETQVASH